MRGALLAVAIAILSLSSAKAETLVISMSSHRVQIASNFVGGELTLFGTVERDATTVARSGRLDLVVVTRGPRQNQTVRLKSPFLGFWINRESRTFTDIPVSYMTQSTRPLPDIADIDVRRRFQIGQDVLNFSKDTPPETAEQPADPFSTALLRLQKARGLYREDIRGVTFVTPTLFRTTIPVPAITATGLFDVDVFLFSGGALLARADTSFEVTKAGFEASIVDLALRNSVVYGLIVALLALFTGWAASVIFRRD